MLVAAAFILSQTAKPEVPFAKEIQAFMAEDRKAPPAKGQILFVGSSSFTRWTDVATYFPKHKILNRGFGGSSIPDVIRYQNQIIYPYKPSQIVIYCGENDVASDAKLAAFDVYERFLTLYSNIREKMPNVPVSFVSLKPSPSRWSMRWKMISINGWIRDLAMSDPKLTFIDVWEPMLDKDRRPIADIFVEDNLHMNAKGYKIWQKVIEPTLLKPKEDAKTSKPPKTQA